MITIGNDEEEIDIIKDEAKSGNSPSVSESASKKVYNSIVRIELKTNFGTGFFMNVKIFNNYLRCLITNYHIIKQDLVNKKEKIDIYYGEKEREKRNSIILDENKRYIGLFQEFDVSIIEILKSDNIEENKYLNYKSEKKYEEYLDKNIYLGGYPNTDIDNKERQISSGIIKRINNKNKFYFYHILDTRSGSSGSPICLLENKKVIGIHKGDVVNKSFNIGIFIGYIIDELNKDEEKVVITNNKHNIILRNLFLNSNEKNKYFFTKEEYNNEIYNIHHKISKYYVNQTENMYYVAFIDLNHFLLNSNIKLEKTRKQIMKSLESFKDIQINYEEIIKSDFINDINIYIMETNYELIMDKFGYFIAGFMKALDLYGTKKNAFLPVESDLEKKKIEMEYKDLLQFKKNINKIISFKTFLNEIAPLNHLQGQIYKLKNNISSFFSEVYNNYLLDKKKFYVSLKIKYNHKDKIWIPNCISVSTAGFPEKTIQLFTFFKIKNVIINEDKNLGEIELQSIGRKEILEEKLCNDLETNYIIYNSEENIFEIEK